MRTWPIIRHVRWFFWAWRCHRAAEMWGRMGIGLGIPNESDFRVLDGIWNGEDLP